MGAACLGECCGTAADGGGVASMDADLRTAVRGSCLRGRGGPDGLGAAAAEDASGSAAGDVASVDEAVRTAVGGRVGRERGPPASEAAARRRRGRCLYLWMRSRGRLRRTLSLSRTRPPRDGGEAELCLRGEGDGSDALDRRLRERGCADGHEGCWYRRGRGLRGAKAVADGLGLRTAARGCCFRGRGSRDGRRVACCGRGLGCRGRRPPSTRPRGGASRGSPWEVSQPMMPHGRGRGER